MKFAWLASHESYQPEELLDQAVLAEQVGFDAVFASDHFHPWVDDTSAAGFVWTWLGAVAARTGRIELATSVTCPLFHYRPGLIAQAVATVDRDAYRPLVTDVGADYVSIQIASVDPMNTIRLVGEGLLPELRATAPVGATG